MYSHHDIEYRFDFYHYISSHECYTPQLKRTARTSVHFTKGKFCSLHNLKDCGWMLDVRFESLSLWTCQFYTVSQCCKWSGPRSYISLGLFTVKAKNISSAGGILQTDRIKRKIPHSESDKHVTPEVPVKFLLNTSIAVCRFGYWF